MGILLANVFLTCKDMSRAAASNLRGKPLAWSR